MGIKTRFIFAALALVILFLVFLLTRAVVVTLVYNGKSTLPPIVYSIEIDDYIKITDTINPTPMTLFTKVYFPEDPGYKTLKVSVQENGKYFEAKVRCFVFFSKYYTCDFVRRDSMDSNISEGEFKIYLTEEAPPF